MGAHGMINYVDARTSWMDGLVRAAAAQGYGQVIIIASGYCTRAYRLHHPGVKARALSAGLRVSRPCSSNLAGRFPQGRSGRCSDADRLEQLSAD